MFLSKRDDVRFKLSISSSLVFYKRIATSEIKINEDLMGLWEVPGRTRK